MNPQSVAEFVLQAANFFLVGFSFGIGFALAWKIIDKLFK